MSSKNPTIKRILKEASELANQPSADFTAAPLETDLFEWHFTLRGPPAPSPFDGGVYHGRIVLPPAYPLKPPSFRFLTPTGRFEVNREICLSISGHHEETWQPAWGIRTALVAIRSFMDTDAKGQLGGMDSSEEVRKRLANQSGQSRCATCGKTNHEIMKEHNEAVKEIGTEAKKGEDTVPEQLQLAYREELDDREPHRNGTSPKISEAPPLSTPALPAAQTRAPAPSEVSPPGQPAPSPTVQIDGAVPQQPQQRRPVDDDLPGWVNPAIYAVMAVLVYLLWKRFV